MRNFLRVLVVFLALRPNLMEACNEAICAPLVSKCMLINCCDCEMNDLKNCSCCHDCQICLSKLYTQCCSCVGLCPPPDPTDEMTKTSTVEELSEPIPDLFKVLTDEEDHLQRWTSFTYAIDLDKLTHRYSSRAKIITVGLTDDPMGTPARSESETLGLRNCSVAFFSDCLSLSKCKVSCRSMGAAKYRWFHQHGCCQCVGHTCVDFGLSEPKCLKCLENTLEFSN